MFKFLKITSLVCLLVLAAICLVGLALFKVSGMHFYDVKTTSMTPLLQPGDLTISAKVNPTDIQVGDIISYLSLQPDHQIITHRVHKIFPHQGYLISKGDGLVQPDPPVPFSVVTGKTVKVIPKLGYATDYIRQPAGLILLIYLPLLLVIVYESHKLTNHFNYQLYAASAKL